jgi:hypothetical protein
VKRAGDYCYYRLASLNHLPLHHQQCRLPSQSCNQPITVQIYIYTPYTILASCTPYPSCHLLSIYYYTLFCFVITCLLGQVISERE